MLIPQAHSALGLSTALSGTGGAFLPQSALVSGAPGPPTAHPRPAAPTHPDTHTRCLTVRLQHPLSQGTCRRRGAECGGKLQLRVAACRDLPTLQGTCEAGERQGGGQAPPHPTPRA